MLYIICCSVMLEINSRITTSLMLAGIVAIFTTASILLPVTSAHAIQRNNLAASNNAGTNTQNALVALGNILANVQVGANVCAIAENC
jgi:hypothetical protein